MAENNYNKRTPMNNQELLNGLMTVPINIAPYGAIYRESNSTLGNRITDLFVNTFNIIECDHCYMYPVSDRSGKIITFNTVMYFNTDRNRGTNSNISRASGPRAMGSNNGSYDLRGFINNNLSTGGFILSDNFKKVVGPIAILDNDNKIVVKADQKYPNVGLVEVDFFRVVALCLGITNDDMYDFSIVNCEPVNNNASGLEYIVTFTKEISTGKPRGRSGVNYEYSDRNLIRNASRRQQ